MANKNWLGTEVIYKQRTNIENQKRAFLFRNLKDIYSSFNRLYKTSFQGFRFGKNVLIQAGLSFYPQNLPFPVLPTFKAEKLTLPEVSIGKKITSTA